MAARNSGSLRGERGRVGDVRRWCPPDAGRGDSTNVVVHEIAGGPLIASFEASIVEVPPSEVDREAVLELLAHVPLGAKPGRGERQGGRGLQESPDRRARLLRRQHDLSLG